MSTQVINTPEFNAAVAEAVAQALKAITPTPAPARKRGDATHEQATAVAKAKFGSRGIAWITTHNAEGVAYKTPRYRVGWTCEELHGRFIEEGRRMWGVGGSWAEAIHWTHIYVPGVPVSNIPSPEDDLKLEAEAKAKAEVEAKLMAEQVAQAEAAAKAAKRTAKRK